MIKLTKDTRVWDKLKKDLMQINKSELQVGWFDSHYGSDNDNLPHAQVAQWNEEGTPTSPPRPFMRVGMKDYFGTGKASKDFRQIVESVLKGQQPMRALAAQGPDFVKHLQAVMRAWSTPPNAALTVALKGFNDPLIETGELVESVSFEVGKS